MRQHGWARKARTFAIGGSAVLGVAIAGLATTMSASAHYIIGTTPQPSVGVVGTTGLADQAVVYADSSRHVVFFLWAPGTCGVQGTSPVFMDSEPVTTSSLTDSTVTSGAFLPQSTGTFQWTAEIVITAGGAIESGPTTCGDEPVTVNKTPTSIDTTPSNAKGAPVGTALTDSATVDGFNPTGNVRFYLFGPDNATCNFDQTSANAPNGWLFMAGPIALVNGKASVPAPGYTTTETGSYKWVADYGGDSNNTEARSECGKEVVAIGKHSDGLTSTASPGGVTGTAIFDTVKVSNGVDPGGTVTFSLYSPADASCKGAAIFTSTVALGTNGTAKSATFAATKTAGTYNWIAVYNGDANNASSNDKCGDEPVRITAVSSGVQGITTPGTGVGFPAAPAIGLLLGGLGLSSIAAAEIRRGRRLI